jgi:hypothetical protein
MPSAGVSGSLSIDGDKREYLVEIEFTFWATPDSNSQGQAKVAAMVDNVQATLEANQTSLLSDNLILVSASPSEINIVEVNEQKLYTAGLLVTFMVTA